MKINEKAAIMRDKMVAAMAQAAATDAGKIILHFIFVDSGFNLPATVVTKSGKVDLEGTFYNNARRDVYLRLRQFMTPEVIKAVEHDFKKEEEVPKDGDRS